jgi:hypothetical protein
VFHGGALFSFPNILRICCCEWPVNKLPLSLDHFDRPTLVLRSLQALLQF